MNNKKMQKYSGFWVRLASILIDGILISSVSVLIFLILILTSYQFVTSELFLKLSLFIFFPFTILPGLLYYSWYNAEGKQTIGKKIFGLLVVDKEFKPISMNKSIFRTIIFTIDSIVFSIGHLLIFFTKKKQTFHDLFTKSYVIEKEPKNRLPWIYLLVIILSFSIGYIHSIILKNFIRSYSVPTSAMERAILVGDAILVNTVQGSDYIPVVGDIVVFKYPLNPSLSNIKRCVAVGGQTLEIIDKEIYIDGKLSPHPQTLKFLDNNIFERTEGKYAFSTYKQNKYGSRDNFGPIKIPDDHYFLMGDNRDNSSDSRQWGFVPQANIQGKAGLIYFSWNSYESNIRWDRLGKLIE